MKPFDGGQWVGVTRIRDAAELHAVYDASGERLMHLQAAVEDFDVFARSLSIGAETMVMHFDPDRPLHDRYQIDHDFLSPELGDEVVTISKLVNAFFRWEFNSCETIVKDGVAYPIDYANASPDVALTSLHYYFPWAIAGARPLVGVLHGHRPADADQPGHARLLRDRRPRGSLLRGEARRVPAARGRLLPGRRVRRVLRRASPASRRGADDYVAGPEFDRHARRHRARRPSRRTSTSSSSPTTAASWAPGSATSSRRGRVEAAAAAAGVVAAGVWAAAEPALARAFRTDYTDVRLLGAPLSRRHWRVAGAAVHLANGAGAGLLFNRLGLRGWKAGIVAAQAEHALLWPGSALVDRFHPDRHTAAWFPLVRNRRVYAQELVVHALFGAIVGGSSTSLRSDAARAEGARVGAELLECAGERLDVRVAEVTGEMLFDRVPVVAAGLLQRGAALVGEDDED